MAERHDSAQTYKVINLTADYTLTRDELPAFITNDGATAAVTVNLPTDHRGGEAVSAVALAAQEIRLNPGDNDQIWGTSATYAQQAAGKYITFNAVGESVELIARDNGDWVTVQQTGTVTAEA